MWGLTYVTGYIYIPMECVSVLWRAVIQEDKKKKKNREPFQTSICNRSLFFQHQMKAVFYFDLWIQPKLM